MMALLLLALAVLAPGLQISLPLPWWPLDLGLLVAAFAGLTRGGGWGLFCGAVSGAALDLVLGPVLGFRLIPLALAGALADALQPGVNRDQPRLQVAAVAGLSLFHDLLLILLARRLDLPQGGMPRVFLAYVAPRAAGQALACIPFFSLLGLLVRQKVFQDPRAHDVRTIRRWG